MRVRGLKKNYLALLLGGLISSGHASMFELLSNNKISANTQFKFDIQRLDVHINNLTSGTAGGASIPKIENLFFHGNVNIPPSTSFSLVTQVIGMYSQYTFQQAVMGELSAINRKLDVIIEQLKAIDKKLDIMSAKIDFLIERSEVIEYRLIHVPEQTAFALSRTQLKTSIDRVTKNLDSWQRSPRGFKKEIWDAFSTIDKEIQVLLLAKVPEDFPLLAVATSIFKELAHLNYRQMAKREYRKKIISELNRSYITYLNEIIDPANVDNDISDVGYRDSLVSRANKYLLAMDKIYSLKEELPTITCEPKHKGGKGCEHYEWSVKKNNGSFLTLLHELSSTYYYTDYQRPSSVQGLHQLEGEMNVYGVVTLTDKGFVKNGTFVRPKSKVFIGPAFGCPTGAPCNLIKEPLKIGSWISRHKGKGTLKAKFGFNGNLNKWPERMPLAGLESPPFQLIDQQFTKAKLDQYNALWKKYIETLHTIKLIESLIRLEKKLKTD